MIRRKRFITRGVLVDAGVSVLLAVVTVRAVLDPPGPAFAGSSWVGYIAGVAVSLPLTLRSRWPLPVLGILVVVTTVATVAGATGTGVLWVTYAATALALYTAAAETRAFPAVVAVTGSLATAAVAIPWHYHRNGITPAAAPNSEVPLWWQVELGMVAAEMASAWAVGRVVRWRRLIRAEFARRLARDAVADERLRIARELHDIVGHSMSVIAVKATVANHIAEVNPTETRAALQTIEHTSRSTLIEIRRLLDVLRDDDINTNDGNFAPSPGVVDLPQVADQLRAAGLVVELTLTEIDGLPAALDLTVYRIVQESLTNVLRHAHASHCSVTVRTTAGSVRIKITDNGHGHRPTGHRFGGHGLIGMQERVAMYRGSFTAGPGPGGGFQVIAQIPYAAEGLA